MGPKQHELGVSRKEKRIGLRAHRADFLGQALLGVGVVERVQGACVNGSLAKSKVMQSPLSMQARRRSRVTTS